MHSHRPLWRSPIIAILLVLAMFVAACGDDDDSGASTDAPSDTDSDAAADTDDGSSGPAVEAAQALVEQFSAPPAEIPVTEQIEADIPTGKTVYQITCGVEICELYEPILTEALDLLGWNLKVISTDGSPESVANAWDQVVRDQPDGVIFTGTPRSQVDQQMRDAAANGTEIVGCCLTDETDDVLDANIYTAEETGEQGEVMAAWAVATLAEKGHEGAGVLYVDLPDFPILTEVGKNFASNFAELCPGCENEVLSVALADLGGVADQIVSALRANDNLKMVIFSTDSISVGVPAALAAAGLDDVEVFGGGPALATLQEVESEERGATIAFPAWEALFSMVDVLVRLEVGEPLASSYRPPNYILTSANIEATDSLPKVVPDVVEQFAAIWGKG